MNITEVRIFPRESEDRKLKAYATITIDTAFVVRNVKVIEGNKGLFVAMPSRKLRDACPKCNYKNAIRSKFCKNYLKQSWEIRTIKEIRCKNKFKDTFASKTDARKCLLPKDKSLENESHN